MLPKTGWTRLGLGVGVAALAAATATGAFGDSGGARTSAAATPMLAVAIVGGGRITSTPAGISCPGKCGATFAAGSRVLLTPTSKGGSRFLRWGGDCTGARACRVRVSALAAVAAQFVGSTTRPTPPPTSAVEPGTYSGPNTTFFVPAGAASVVNFSSRTYVYCAGGGGPLNTPFNLLKATIKRDGAFAATTSQNGVVDGANAKLTYSVTGRFQGRSSAGAAAADGVYRVDIVFSDTPNRKCTSNEQSWTAARSQPTTKSIEPGTYSGPNTTFFVPAGAESVVNFSSRTYVYCAGGGGPFNTPFKILTATIKGDRSFTATTSQNAVVGGANAKLTYSVTGSFQGFSSSGAAGASGVFRVDIVFTDTPNRRCTSNDQLWTAARSG